MKARPPKLILSLSSNPKPQLKRIDYQGFVPTPVIGVDEVGRGCLAGAVYAAAVFIEVPNLSRKLCAELTDSKLLSEKRREELSALILAHHQFGLGSASVEEIDQINILQASLLAMKRAVLALEEKLHQQAGHVLIDGNFRIPGLLRTQTPIVKGDLRCLPISAASIVAKVARDREMRLAAEAYPIYGFEKHKGYASEFHRKAIQAHGPAKIHRQTFKGVKEFL